MRSRLRLMQAKSFDLDLTMLEQNSVDRIREFLVRSIGIFKQGQNALALQSFAATSRR